ncbi:MAG: NifB/NifX family molybdenum-iron cluster-binding protein [Planctomycetota bacterium]|nr:NifB/NifX family molybdenum-iron cluster-binding protein [Planctomycetota bacterium]
MKIAVASTDGVAVSAHFGRSTCFVVYTLDDGNKIVSREVRDNTFTPHAQGLCKGGEDGHEHHHDASHSHAQVVTALSDCQAMLCGGMGGRAAQELAAAGVRPMVAAIGEMTADQALQGLLEGTLQPTGSFCRCHEQG